MQILYKNVQHPKLAAFIKEHSWVMESGEYLTFPQNQSELRGGILHYLESIEEVNFLRCREFELCYLYDASFIPT